MDRAVVAQKLESLLVDDADLQDIIAFTQCVAGVLANFQAEHMRDAPGLMRPARDR